MESELVLTPCCRITITVNSDNLIDDLHRLEHLYGLLLFSNFYRLVAERNSTALMLYFRIDCVSIESTAISTAQKTDSLNLHMQWTCPTTQATMTVSKAPRRNFLFRGASLGEASPQRIHEHLDSLVNVNNGIFGRYQPGPRERLVLSLVPDFDTTHCEPGFQSSDLGK